MSFGPASPDGQPVPHRRLCEGRLLHAQAELRQSAQNAFFKISAEEIDSMKAALGGVLAEPPVERKKAVASL